MSLVWSSDYTWFGQFLLKPKLGLEKKHQVPRAGLIKKESSAAEKTNSNYNLYIILFYSLFFFTQLMDDFWLEMIYRIAVKGQPKEIVTNELEFNMNGMKF